MCLLPRSKACILHSLDSTDTEDCNCSQQRLEPTSLWLPPTDSCKDNGNQLQRLYLPKRSCSAPCSLDEHLSLIPTVRSRAESLLSLCKPISSDKKRYRRSMSTSIMEDKLKESQTCINVLQGEVAHASPLHTDVIVSADATTCHIVALWSTTTDSTPLASVAHIDQAEVYSSCLESMILEHILHHSTRDSSCRTVEVENGNQEGNDFGFFVDNEESICEGPEQDPAMIEMELHIVGGYLDKEGTSQEISTSLIQAFSELATKYENQVRITLSTAAMSCLNNHKSNETNEPKGRGLGIETKTGKVFPIDNNIPTQWEGPAIDVRSARGLATPSEEEASDPATHNSKMLTVIHDTSCGGEIRVQPFQYQPIHQLNVLLHVPDEVLLQVASTSPQCESETFCTKFRKSISFMNTIPIEDVFGDMVQNPRPLIFSRSAHDLNQWEEIRQSSE